MRKVNRSNEGRWLSRRARRTRRQAVITPAIIVSWIVVIPSTLANEPSASEERTADVASNQHIDLSAARETRKTNDGASDTTSHAGDGPGVVPERVGTASGTIVMRRGGSHERVTPFAAPQTPWYRSGLVALLIVLAVVWLVYWVVRRWIPAIRVGESNAMRVVARATLGPKQHLALIRLGRRFVMVGVSSDRVDRLCTIDDEEEVLEIANRTNSAAATTSLTFDEELVREAREYDRNPVLESNETHSRGAAAPDRRPSLKALLDRLRTLQAN